MSFAWVRDAQSSAPRLPWMGHIGNLLLSSVCPESGSAVRSEERGEVILHPCDAGGPKAWRLKSAIWSKTARATTLAILICLNASSSHGNQIEGLEKLQTRLDHVTGRERLEVLVEIIATLREEDPSRVLVHGTEALALLETFPSVSGKLSVLNALCSAAYAREQHESAVEFGEKAEALARQEGDRSALGVALACLGRACRRLGEHHRALEVSQEAASLFETLGYQSQLGEAWNAVGYAYWRLGNFPGALTAYLRAHDAFERVDDRSGIGKSLRNMGNLYSDLGRLEESLEVLDRALAIQREAGNESEIGHLLTSLGKTHLIRGDSATALDYLVASLEIKERLGQRTGIGVVLNLLGTAHRDRGDLEPARHYFEQALRLRREVGDRKRSAETMLGVATIDRMQGRFEAAISRVRESLAIAEELDARNVVRAAHHEMATIYESLEQYREANESLRQHERVNNEIFNVENSRAITEAWSRFEVDQMRRQVELLQSRQESYAAQNKRNRSVRAILLSGLAGLGLIIALSAHSIRRLVGENLRLRESLATRVAADEQPRREPLDFEQVDTESGVTMTPIVRAGIASAATSPPTVEEPGVGESSRSTDQALIEGPTCLCLRSRTGKQRQVFTLSPGEYRIGRTRDNEIVVPTAEISRQHAQLSLGPEAIEIRDLGSVNGTWVNGRRVDRCAVHLGDVLQLGSTELILEEIDTRDTELGLTLDDPEKEPTALCDAVEAEDDTSTLFREQFAGLFPKLAVFDDHLMGKSSAMCALYDAMHTLVGAEMTVLIEGETGVGKEGIARILHQSASRKDGPFIVVNCAAIPSELLEAEMFGIEEGVATGVKARSGWFRSAQGGTLVLDEIGDMPLQLQAKLLRALQEKRIQPVGGVEFSSDVWVIGVTNQNLHELADQGSFRKDLYYRLAGAILRVPTLRERPEDIALLIGFFLKSGPQDSKRVRGLTVKAMARLESYQWPGNVRELGNEVKRLKNRVADGQMIDSTMLSAHILEESTEASSPRTLPSAAPARVVGPAGDSLVTAQETRTPESRTREPLECEGTYRLKEHVHATERRLISHVLAQTGTSQRKAAVLLGISRSTLARKIADLGISNTSSS